MNDQPARITINTPIEFSDPLPEAVDVVVIGGGIIGIFTALNLARMGKRVLVCEKGRVAGEQSSRNWGWIRQHNRDRAELPIMMEAMRLWHEVDRETNDQCGVVTADTTYLALNDEEMKQHERFIPIAHEHGLDTRILSKQDVAEQFSGQGVDRWVGGVSTRGDARGEPWTAVPAVARLARQAGAIIRENCAVRTLDITGGVIKGVVTEDGRVACEQVVLAGGAWSSLLARQHGVNIPQLSVRSTAIRTNPLPEFSVGNVSDTELSLRPRADGGYTLAVSGQNGFYLGPDALRHFTTYLPIFLDNWRELSPRPAAPTGFPDGWGTPRTWSENEISPFEKNRVLEPAPNQSYVRLLVERFGKKFPALGRPKVINSWAGMIDAMPDEVPVVDRVASIDGLIIATGMCGHGFGIGPGFGRVIASMAAGKDLGHDMHRFRLSRFNDGNPLVRGPMR